MGPNILTGLKIFKNYLIEFLKWKHIFLGKLDCWNTWGANCKGKWMFFFLEYLLYFTINAPPPVPGENLLYRESLILFFNALIFWILIKFDGKGEKANSHFTGVSVPFRNCCLCETLDHWLSYVYWGSTIDEVSVFSYFLLLPFYSTGDGNGTEQWERMGETSHFGTDFTVTRI